MFTKCYALLAIGLHKLKILNMVGAVGEEGSKQVSRDGKRRDRWELHGEKHTNSKERRNL